MKLQNLSVLISVSSKISLVRWLPPLELAYSPPVQVLALRFNNGVPACLALRLLVLGMLMKALWAHPLVASPLQLQ